MQGRKYREARKKWNQGLILKELRLYLVGDEEATKGSFIHFFTKY